MDPLTSRAWTMALLLVASPLVGCGDDGMGMQRPGTGIGASPSGAGGSPGAGGTPGLGGTPGSGGTLGAGGTEGGVGGSPGTSGGNPGGNPGGDPSNPSGIDLEGNPKFYRVVRLTNAQWGNSVRDALKLSAPTGLEANFQNTVSGTTDFSNNELLLEVNQRGWEDYRNAAEQVAEQVTASSGALTAVYSGTDASGFINTVGRRIYRRPLTQAETTAYMDLFSKGSAMSGTKSAFAKGAALVLRGMLQSPHFLYRTELSPKGSPLSGYEVAAKLSLWLHGTTPSDALLDAAERLTTAEAVGTQANAMLEQPQARTVMREFQRELMHLDRYTQISKVNVPNYTEALNAELQETSYLFFDNIFGRGMGVKDILTTTKGFVGPEMAKLYGIQETIRGFTERDLGPNRTGYFAQVPYLTLHGINAQPDSIHRGVSIALDVLCAPLGPPAEIPPLPPLKPGQTNRQRISTLTGACGMACHNELINPLGFALENFDGMGQYREEESGGLKIDSSGSFSFSEGRKQFRGAAELMNLIAGEPQTHLCYAKKLASFGLQRDVTASDLAWLQQIAMVSQSQGGSVKRIIVELAKSDAFRTRFGGAL